MSSQQFDPDLSETAQQINDLFDFAELSKAIRTSRLSRQRPLCADCVEKLGVEADRDR